MTTIILTIIGILLAAAAALMVIFYGGDAFNSGSIGAQANTYQNAGTNVISAIELAKADDAPTTAFASVAALQGGGAGADDNYLKELPALNDSKSNSLTSPTAGTYQYQVVLAGSNPVAVCARINKNLKLATAPTSVDPTVKMGCYDATTTQTFFANA